MPILLVEIDKSRFVGCMVHNAVAFSYSDNIT